MRVIIVILICAINLNGKTQNNVLIPYKVGNYWGYADTTGKLLIRPQFLHPAVFKNNEAYVEKETGQGVINSSGHFIVEPNFSSVSPLFDSIYYCKYNGLYGLIHSNRDTLAPFIYVRKSFISDVYEYTNSKSKVKIVSFETKVQKDIYRYQNGTIKNILTIPINYQVSYNTVRMTLTVSSDDSVFTYDINGKQIGLEVIPIEIRETVEEELIYFEFDMDDESNQRQIESQPKKSYPAKTYFHNKKKVGLIYEYQKLENRKFVLYKDSIPALYDSIVIYGFNIGMYKVMNKNKWGLIDSKNKIVVPLKYQNIEIHKSRIFKPSKGNNYFYIYLKSKLGWSIHQINILPEGFEMIQLSKEYFDEITPFTNNEFLSVTKKDGKYGVYNLYRNEQTLPHIYSEIIPEINFDHRFPIFKIKALTGETLYVGYNGVHFFEGFGI